MPKSELAEEINTEPRASGPVELFIGITGAFDAAELQQRAREALQHLMIGGDPSRVVVAYPGDENGSAESAPDATARMPRLMAYSLPASDPTHLPWVVTSAAQKAVCTLAAEVQAKVCVLLQGDLALLQPDALQALISPIVEKSCDLVVPIYPSGKFDGLLNH